MLICGRLSVPSNADGTPAVQEEAELVNRNQTPGGADGNAPNI